MSGCSRRLPLKKLTSCLTCTLCGGYFVDASTITECLHSFCKTCIVLYLQTSSFCPVCDVLVHKTRPLVGVRPDRILQDLVYKLVPGLFANELKRRKQFYLANPDLDPGGNLMTFPPEDPSSGAVGSMSPSDRSSSDASEDRFYTEEEQISVALEFSANGRPVDDHCCTDDLVPCRLPAPRYLLCPAPFTIKLLKKFIRDKYGLPEQFLIEVFYAEESLNDSYTLMDIAYIYTWQRSVPLRLFYSIYNTGGPEAETMSQCMETPPSPSTPPPSTPPTSLRPSTTPSTPPRSSPHSTPPSTPPRSPTLGEDISPPQSHEATSSTNSSPTHQPKRKPYKTARWQSVRLVDQRRVVREALKFTIKPREGLIRRTSSSSSSTETITETTTCTETRTRTVRRKRLKLSQTLRRKFRRLEANDDNDFLSEKLAHLKLPESGGQKTQNPDNNFLRVENDSNCRWEIRNYSFRCGEASSSSISPSSSGSSPHRAFAKDNRPYGALPWRSFSGDNSPLPRSPLSDGTSPPSGSNLNQSHFGTGSSPGGPLFCRNLSSPANLSLGYFAHGNSDKDILPQDKLPSPSSTLSLSLPKDLKNQSRKPSSWKRPLHFSPTKPICRAAVSSMQAICMTNTVSRPTGFIDASSPDAGLLDTVYTSSTYRPLASCQNDLPSEINVTKALAVHTTLVPGSSMMASNAVVKFGTTPFINANFKRSLPLGVGRFSNSVLNHQQIAH